jgi:hypothetical protein
MYCTSSLYEFSVRHDFTRSGFTGQHLDNRVIGCCPLLTAKGPVYGKKLQFSEIIENIKGDRPELTFIDADKFHALLSHQMTEEDRNKFYQMLYTEEIVALQTSDSLWKAVTTDFVLVFRLRQGMDIHTFNQMTRKKVTLEAELWEPATMETVWRTKIYGTCSNRGVSDQKFLSAALRKGVTALPNVAPSYNDSKPW